MWKTILVVITAIASLVGCTPLYVQPSTGDTAEVRLRLATHGAYFALMHTYEGPGCKGPQAIGIIGEKRYVADADMTPNRRVRSRMIGSTAVPESNTIEISVKAGRPLTILYNQIGPHDAEYVRGCKLPISFVPESGEQYEVRYAFDGSKCTSEVFLLRRDGTMPVPMPGVVKESAACKGTNF